MGRKPRPKRKSKEVNCFIVEGYTEKNYIKLLKKLYKKSGDVKNSEGGSAKSVLNKAKKLISQEKDNYSGYIIWFDADRYDTSMDSNLKNSLEAKSHTKIFITQPCIELWLLAHFENVIYRERECRFYEKQLESRYIPNYEKNDCLSLDDFIDKEKIKAAVQHYPEIGEIPKDYFW